MKLKPLSMHISVIGTGTSHVSAAAHLMPQAQAGWAAVGMLGTGLAVGMRHILGLMSGTYTVRGRVVTVLAAPRARVIAKVWLGELDYLPCWNLNDSNTRLLKSGGPSKT